MGVKFQTIGNLINASPDWYDYHCLKVFYTCQQYCFVFKALESVITLNLDSLEKAVSMVYYIAVKHQEMFLELSYF